MGLQLPSAAKAAKESAEAVERQYALIASDGFRWLPIASDGFWLLLITSYGFCGGCRVTADCHLFSRRPPLATYMYMYMFVAQLRHQRLSRTARSAAGRRYMRQIAGDDEKRNRFWGGGEAARAARAAGVAPAKQTDRELQIVREGLASAASAAARAWGDERVEYGSVGGVYFHAHAQGKQACRLRRAFLPPGGGVHGFASEGRALRTLTCGGLHDPAVLHYANCGFEAWVRKYEILGDIPNYENRKDLAGFRKHRAAGCAKHPPAAALAAAALAAAARAAADDLHKLGATGGGCTRRCVGRLPCDPRAFASRLVAALPISARRTDPSAPTWRHATSSSAASAAA